MKTMDDYMNMNYRMELYIGTSARIMFSYVRMEKLS